MEKTFTKEYRVTHKDTDFNGRMNIAALGHYVLDIAGMHAIEIKTSMDILNSQNLTWVVSGMHFGIIKELPAINSIIKITTKISEISRLSCKRDFYIEHNGEIVAEGTVLMKNDGTLPGMADYQHKDKTSGFSHRRASAYCQLDNARKQRAEIQAPEIRYRAARPNARIHYKIFGHRHQQASIQYTLPGVSFKHGRDSHIRASPLGFGRLKLYERSTLQPNR